VRERGESIKKEGTLCKGEGEGEIFVVNSERERMSMRLWCRKIGGRNRDG